MQQGGRNPCSSSAERAGATAVAFLLPPPPPPFPPPPPRVPRAASPLPVRLSRAAITSGATWLRSGNIQIHKNLLSGQTDPQKFAPERQYPDPLIQKFALPKTDWLF